MPLAWIPPASIRRRQSAIACSSLNILLLPQLLENSGDGHPLLALGLQRPLAVGFQGVILAFAPRFGLTPPRFDPTLPFHPVQDRVEHPISPLDFVAGEAFDFLNQSVTRSEEHTSELQSHVN